MILETVYSAYEYKSVENGKSFRLIESDMHDASAPPFTVLYNGVFLLGDPPVLMGSPFQFSYVENEGLLALFDDIVAAPTKIDPYLKSYATSHVVSLWYGSEDNWNECRMLSNCPTSRRYML